MGITIGHKYRWHATTSTIGSGFKSKHSTDMYIFSVNHYEPPMYMTPARLSYSYHWTLFSKLITQSVPCPLVRIIMYW